jgi:hypothetical protein
LGYVAFREKDEHPTKRGRLRKR